jgi:branched-chain amino acid transport system permease protein
MTTFLTFTVLGLVLGSVYAIAASGLVLTYNTSGIFNFAHGAQAMIGAFTFHQMQVIWGLPTLFSTLVVLAVLGPVMGYGLHALVMRGLRDTEEITKIVVTVAILLGFVSLSQWLWDPQESRIPTMFFGADSTVTVLGVVVRYHELLCLGAALAIAVALRLLFTRSRVGVVMRAAVDDPDLLRLNGHDPDRVASWSWMLGSTLAVLAGILITPVMGGVLEANALTLLVIDAFAAALFGRLRSIPRTFLGAMVLGLTGSYLVAYAPVTWSFVTNLREALPMVVLVVVLLVLPQDRLRGAAVRSRERYETPPVRRAGIWAVAFIALVLAFGRLLDDSGVHTLLVGLAFAIVALSLTLLTGYAGQVNLAPLAFAAISTIVAFHTGIEGTGMSARMNGVGLLAGVLAAAVTGALVALPAVRLRGLYLALATLAFGVFVSAMVLRDTVEHTVLGRTFSIFPYGNLLVPPLRIGNLDLANPDTFLLVEACVFAVLGLGVVVLRNRGYGRRLAALKDSPVAAAMLGQRIVWLKLTVFTLSTAIAGLGGIFMSMALTSVSAEHFVVTISLSLVMLTVVGGIGYVSGALLAGLTAGAGLTVVSGTLSELAMAHEEYAGTLGTVSHLLLVSTALVGMSVARSPSGALHEIFAAHRTLARAPEVRYGAIALQLGLYVVAVAGAIGTWTFTLLSLALWLILPAIGAAVRPERMFTAEQRASRRVTSLEQVGVDSAYPLGIAEQLDRALGVPSQNRPQVDTPRPRPTVSSQAKGTAHVSA